MMSQDTVVNKDVFMVVMELMVDMEFMVFISLWLWLGLTWRL